MHLIASVVPVSVSSDGSRNRRLSPHILYGVFLLACFSLLWGCGRLERVPATFDPQVYKPIEYQELLAPRQSGLQAGQKVQVKAYFWEYLTYDPAMVQNYLTLFRYPVRWYQLQWFATYGSENMTGYFDLAALAPEQAERYKLSRLEPIMIYGELAPLPPGLFLQVHFIEKIPSD